MTHEPTAVSLLRAALAPMLDGVGLALLAWLGFQVLFGGSQPFETEALWVGGIGTLACAVAPGASRNLPLPMVAYVGVALLSAAVHRWTGVASAPSGSWLGLFASAAHLLTMVVYVFGTAHLLRTPRRLAPFAVLLVVAINVVAVQIMFDRLSTNFIYSRAGSISLPSVVQWGGLHQTGMLLVLALPFFVALFLLGQSVWQRGAAVVLAAALIMVAVVNGSTGAIVAMASAIGMMVLCVVGKNARFRLGALLAVAVVATLAGLLIAVSTGRVPLVASGDLAGRVPIWRAAAAIIQDHPWLGVGPGRYSFVMQDGGYAARYLAPGASGVEQAHNMFLHVAAETGIAGVLCFAAWWAWMLRAGWRSWIAGHSPLISLGVTFAIAGFLVRSMSDHFLDNLVTTDRTRVLMWTLFASVVALQRLPVQAAGPPP